MSDENMVMGIIDSEGHIQANGVPLLLSGDNIKLMDYGKGNRNGTPEYVLCVKDDGELIEVSRASFSSGGNTSVAITTVFLHNGNTSSSTWLKHEFEGNNTSNSSPWKIPVNGTIVNIVAQGRNQANNKSLDIYVNGLVADEHPFTNTNQELYSVSIPVVIGDEISVRMEDLPGNSQGWDDPIVWLYLE